MTRRVLEDGDETLLIKAAKIPNNSDEIRRLLSTEEVERRDFYEMTPLMHAASSGTPDNIKALVVDGKANINAVDAEGRNALMYAASFGSSEVVRELLNLGANPFSVDIYKQNACDRAEAFKKFENMAIISNKIDKLKLIPHPPTVEKPDNRSPRKPSAVSINRESSNGLEI